jgi:hypothetical protein
MVFGGFVFALLAVVCIAAGVMAVRRQGGFEPMTREERAAERGQS